MKEETVLPAEVETMFYTRDLPWHGMGVRLEDYPDSKEAIIAASLDWEVEKRQIYVDVSKNENVLEVIPYANRMANVRVTDNSILGIISNSHYKIVQNREAFAFTDALLGEGVRYETAGSLFGGKKVWLLARLPDAYDILGDKVDKYLCFINSFDGASRIRAITTGVRVVCQNTLNMALSGAKRTWSVNHSGQVKEKLDEARKSLGLAENYFANLAIQAEKLANIKVDYEEMVEKLFPIDEDTTERILVNNQRKRSTLLDILNVDDLKSFKGTGWGFVGAVADMETHVRPLRNTTTWKETRLNRSFEGFTLLDSAMNLVLKKAA
jgi:phage/plasmid-like protein (TIGR03299 family)